MYVIIYQKYMKPITQLNNVRRCYKACVVAALIFSLPVRNVVDAQVVVLSDQNSTASINLGSQAGMNNWTVDGLNQLNQQWFWFGVGNNPEASIDTIGAPVFSVVGGRFLTTLYTAADFSIQIDYLLTGGSLGSGVSDIGESIRIRNLTAAPLSFHFFQYSDFDLGGPGNDVIQLGKNLQGKFNEAAQTDGLVGLTETVVTPGANHGEAGVWNLTLAKLSDGVASVLNDNLNPVGPGNVTWAFQWDFTLAPNGSFLISKDKYIQIQNVPEPTSSLLFVLFGGLVAKRFYRRS